MMGQITRHQVLKIVCEEKKKNFTKKHEKNVEQIFEETVYLLCVVIRVLMILNGGYDL